MNKGLYIHFPFCEKKCNYCDFYSLASRSGIKDYLKAVIREIEALKSYNVDTVYFGGGTPSLMDGVSLNDLICTVKSRLTVADNAEITLEANPMSLKDSHKLSDFRRAGVNRLSIGVQSFSDSELTHLGRGHTAEEAAATVKAAREAGFDNISVDLMFAIPHQTVKSFEKTLDTAIELGVEHISVYALGIEEKTVFGVRQRRGEDLFLPSEDEEWEMYLLACEKLNKAGFEHYEISNFAKEGRRSRHNMKYWRAEEYIGIGASAHSYLDGVRYSTPADVKSFCLKAIKEDSYTNTTKDRAEEYVMLSLRLKDGMSLEALKDYGITPAQTFDGTVQQLIKEGFCMKNGDRISLTERGFFVSNTIIVKILDSLQFTP